MGIFHSFLYVYQIVSIIFSGENLSSWWVQKPGHLATFGMRCGDLRCRSEQVWWLWCQMWGLEFG